MLRRIHIHKSRLVLRRLLPARTQLRETGPVALLGQSLVDEDATDIFVPDDEPCKASVPQLNLGDRIVGAEVGILEGWFGAFWTGERKFWKGWRG